MGQCLKPLMRYNGNIYQDEGIKTKLTRQHGAGIMAANTRWQHESIHNFSPLLIHVAETRHNFLLQLRVATHQLTSIVIEQLLPWRLLQHLLMVHLYSRQSGTSRLSSVMESSFNHSPCNFCPHFTSNSSLVAYANGYHDGRAYTAVCLSVYPHDISKTDAARDRITKLDMQMFHNES